MKKWIFLLILFWAQFSGTSFAVTVEANFTSVSTIPVTAASYTATGNTLNITLGFTPEAGTNLTLVKNTGSGFIQGTFSNLTQGQQVILPYAGKIYQFVANYYGGSGNDLVLHWNINGIADFGLNSLIYKNFKMIKVSTGYNHNLAVCSDGTVAAWGSNSSGQLGNNSTTPSNVPVSVSLAGALSNKTVVAVAAGSSHSLALCSDGTVAAWGSNSDGQLGNNSTTDSNVPVLVDQTGVLSGKTVVAVSAGSIHSLALCSDGTVVAWGSNSNGSLGNNSTSNSSVPVLVENTGALNGKTVVAVSAGSYHSLVVCSDGTVAAWGNNGSGQLGNNSATSRIVPVLVNQAGVLSGKKVVAVVAGGSHSLARCSDGTVAAWGSNSDGQLGNNSTTSSSVPTLISQAGVLSGKTVITIAAGQCHSLAVCSDGTVAAWGYNGDGQLGNDSPASSSVPVLVDNTGVLNGRTVVSLSSGFYHSLAVCSDGTVATWGGGGDGQLGNNSQANSSVPVLVNLAGVLSSKTVVAVSAGGGHNLALCSDNTVAAWGNNAVGALGNNSNISSSGPVLVNRTGVLNGKTLIAVAAGGNHSLALCSDGNVASWGYNYSGALGNNSTASSSVPVLVNQAGVLSGKTLVAVAAGGDHSLALSSDGAVAAWGSNSSGQLGNNSTASSSVPVLINQAGVLNGKTVVAVSAGADHNLALCSDGTVAAWGSNSFGQLGNNSTTSSRVPVLVNQAGVLNGKTVVAVSAGAGHNLALCSDGTVAAWGSNLYGQLGNNSTTNSKVPVLISQAGVLSGKNAVAVAAGSAHSLALCSDSTIAAWGINYHGELGNNSNVNSSVPVLANLNGFLSGKPVATISAGGDKSILIIGGLSSECTLSSMNLSDTTISPTFVSSITSYTAVATSATSSITITPVLTDPTATVKVNGTSVASGSASGPVPLNVGANTITVLVTAQDATTTKAYTVNVTRISNVATLSGLTLSAGTLSPSFGAATTTYATSVPNTTSSITVSPSLADLTATVKVNGTLVAAGSASGPISLNVGTNTITVLVTAQDGTTTKAYSINVTRQSSEAGLFSLAMSAGSLSPTFSSGTTSYTTSLSDNVSSIRLTPVPTDANATVKVNGVTVALGSASQSIPLGADAGVITIVVSAQDPTFTKAYTVTIAERVLTSANQALVTASSYSAAGDIPLLKLGFAPQTGAELRLVNNTGLAFITGQFQNLKQGQQVIMTYGGVEYRFVADYFGGTGNDLVLYWADNRIIGWGENQYGQLGIGGNSDRIVPTDLIASGVLSGKKVKMAASGHSHTLALAEDGTLSSWGFNASGQLGNNNTYNSSIPGGVAIPGFLGGKQIVAVAAGGDSSLALCSDGTLASWGDNSNGQLGDGSSKVNSIIPVNITGKGDLSGRTVVAIACGNAHALAFCSDGRIVAWGANGNGQLGTGNNSTSNLPVLVKQTAALSGKTVVAVSAGWKHSLARCSDGTVVAWGDNSSGQLGNNSTTDSSLPVAVLKQGGLSGKTVTDISAGGAHSLAVCSDGSVAAWGLNGSGQLGNGGNNTSYVPVAVTMTSGVLLNKKVTVVSAALDHSLARCADGTLVAWGDNANGKLGNNSTTSSNLPVMVSTSGVLGGKKVSGVYAGRQQSFVICSDGTLAAWGLNASGQLGDNSVDTSLIPVAVTTTSGALFGKTVVSVTPGQSHTLVRFSDGTMASWGLNASGQLGNNSTTDSNIPVGVYIDGVLSGKIVASVRAGEAHNIALCSDGTVVTWGDNSKGQLGTGTGIVSSVIPVDVTGLGVLSGKTVVAVAAGAQHCLALCSDGTLAAWGRGDYGQLGRGTTSNSSLPVLVNQSGVLAITSGAHHNMVLSADGTLAAWGLNSSGQIGNNLAGNCYSPVLVTKSSGALMGKTVIAMAAGAAHSMALCSDGSVAAWGANANGQLGTVGTNGSYVPVTVVTSVGALYGKTVTRISCGEYHSMALCSDQSLATWGMNSSGQLGINGLTDSDIPESVTRAGSLAGTKAWAIAAGGAASFSQTAIPVPTLTDLALSKGSLSPDFSTNIENYTAAVADTVTSIKITPSTRDFTDEVVVNGEAIVPGNASSPIPLVVGSNVIRVTVTAADGTINRTYTITVTRSPSAAVMLAGLDLSAGSLSPVFSGSTLAYTVNVANATNSIKLTPSVDAPSVTLKVNGLNVASGSASQSIPLSSGPNTLTVDVVAQDGITTTTYTLVVTRALSSVATLSGLTLSSGSLSPAFSSATKTYTASVTNAASTISMTPVATDATASIMVNGSVVPSGSASQYMPLIVGQNIFNILVTAQDGTTTSTYTLTVTRSLSSVAALSGLTLSSGSLSPIFSSGTMNYTAIASNATTNITVTPTSTDQNATVKVNGNTVISGNASQSVPLIVGSNTITVLVTAPDGITTFTYTVTITRAPSDIVTLSGIVLSSGTLNPTFSSSITSYEASVTNTTTSMTVMPTVVAATSTVKVNGTITASGNASQSIPLSVGANTIIVRVTAQDGVTTQTYTLTITRAPSAIATLSGLSLSSGTLSPVFSASTTSYTSAVANIVSSIKVTPKVADTTATVKVNGVPTASGTASASIPLVVGTNTISVLVSAQDGTTTKTYTVKVTRAKSPDATLSGLVVNTATLSPKFKATTTSYTAAVTKSVSSVKIRPTSNHSKASIKVNGKEVKSGSLSAAIPLEIGKNTIKVEVTAEDGTSKTYKITLTRGAALKSAVALGLNPEAVVLPESRKSKVTVDGQRYLQLTLLKPTPGFDGVVEVSPDLVNWFSGKHHTTVMIDDDRTLTVRDKTPIKPGTKRFIRVKQRQLNDQNEQD